MSKELITKVHLILEKIGYIEKVIEQSGSISAALHDLSTYRPAILMHLTSIAEQFDKMKKAPDTSLIQTFDADDLKGICDVRNYIAHDYEGVNLSIIEWILRNILPKFKLQCEQLINQTK